MKDCNRKQCRDGIYMISRLLEQDVNVLRVGATFTVKLPVNVHRGVRHAFKLHTLWG